MVHRLSSRSASFGPPRAAPPPGRGAPADDEFIGGAFDEASLVSLDFDDASASRSLHDAEPESAFDTFDAADSPQRAPLRDAADLVDDLTDDPFGIPDPFDDVDDPLF